MSDLLIFTVAEGRYKAYAELFEFCVKRAYPEYFVYVEMMDLRKYPYCYADKFIAEHPHYASCSRFLYIPPRKVGDCRYTYITDIDMMICPEKPALKEFHITEMERTRLRYSNVPRFREPQGDNRLTGLHFVDYDWWDITAKARAHEKEKLVFGEIGSCKCDDELMLMRIVKNSGLAVPERSNLLVRHHGIHLGTLRDYRKQSLQKRRGAVMSRIRPYAGYWCNLIDTDDYKHVVRNIRDKDILWELKELEKFARQLTKERP